MKGRPPAAPLWIPFYRKIQYLNISKCGQPPWRRPYKIIVCEGGARRETALFTSEGSSWFKWIPMEPCNRKSKGSISTVLNFLYNPLRNFRLVHQKSISNHCVFRFECVFRTCVLPEGLAKEPPKL